MPATTDIGNHCDDCGTAVPLPFRFRSTAARSPQRRPGPTGYFSLGMLSVSMISSAVSERGFSNIYLPVRDRSEQFLPAGKGIFTLTTGSAPDRTFYIEWRNCLYATSTTCIAGSDNNYEIVLYEGQPSFDIVYGAFGAPNATLGAIGVQLSSAQFDQSQCNAGRPASSRQTYTPHGFCGTPTVTPTNTPTATATSTATATATSTNTPTNTPTNTRRNTPTADRDSTATSTPTGTPTATPVVRSRADFDGDGKTDLSVFRPSEGNWYYQGSTQGFMGLHFGESTDIPAPGDFDNDGKTDISVFRPSNGFWYSITAATAHSSLSSGA